MSLDRGERVSTPNLYFEIRGAATTQCETVRQNEPLSFSANPLPIVPQALRPSGPGSQRVPSQFQLCALSVRPSRLEFGQALVANGEVETILLFSPG